MQGEAILIWGVLFSGLGLGFFLYGKKQKAVVPLISGIVLMVYPYFIADVYILVLIGVILIALPYFIRI